MQKSPSYSLWFWIVSLVLILAKIAFTLRPEIDLFTEEAQYWLWSQNMAWHYYSKPPMVAVLNYLSTSVLGNTELGVRINAMLLGLGMSWFTFLLGRKMYTEKVGFWSAILLQAMPFWWLASTFHMTDSALTFFWTVGLYSLYRSIEENRLLWWISTGLAIALGIMSKVVMILLPAMALAFVILSPMRKKYLKGYILMAGVSLLGFIPMLIWNWQNDFYTFKHLTALGGGGGSSEGFDLLKSLGQFGAYLGGQLAILSIFLLPLFWGWFKSLPKNLDSKTLFLLLAPLMSFGAFAVLSFMTDIEVNWPVFAYTGIAIGLASWAEDSNGAWAKVRNWGIGLSIGIPLFFLLPDITLLKSISPLAKAEKGVFRRNSAYEPLAERLVALSDSLGVKDPFYFSETYHMASEMSFYLPGNPQTFMINMGARKNQFDLWPDMSQFLGQKKVGVFVSWNYHSPGEYMQFENLLYEEKFEIPFKGLEHRVATIQVWENLEEFSPYIPESF